ncbi:putative sugar O-methyltransferase [Streptomyces sp. RK75]|uniref:putative sugar O-methyltransferase n=1 Tax=Streptomyces sp. RK75 TaxID=2824895 RepID=UPI001B368BB8|nr:putative sugar O-methyltransferase [Streptomyces sp. RK75]MBQ0865956.1 putative sugar O-methyltransferase [Streptomyces sp. RK75]
MAQGLQASRQWQRISELWVTEEASADLTDFKSDPRNFHLALWDPTTNGVRYLKALLYELATRLTPEEWARIEKVRNREVGNPIAVRIDGKSVCLDYLQASQELGFIEKAVELRGARVLEIGAGYGRVCHAMLSNYDLAEYCIVDLKNTLGLSRRYLREVLDDKQFAKVRFIPVDDDVAAALESSRFDLCVNVHSFTEMAPETVTEYLRIIDRVCTGFFVKNPVGKYLDKSMDGYRKGDEAVQMALENGPLRQLLDIHDTEAVKAAVPAFLDAYRPGHAWTCVREGRGIPWSYFWQAVYTKNDGGTNGEGSGTNGEGGGNGEGGTNGSAGQ